MLKKWRYWLIRALHDNQKASIYNDSQILNDNNPEISTTTKCNNFGLMPDVTIRSDDPIPISESENLCLPTSFNEN